MNTKEIQAMIADKSGSKITVIKKTGSMRPWTTFSIYAPFKDPKSVKEFSWELQREIKAMFPAINKESGCFTNQYQFDILTQHISA